MLQYHFNWKTLSVAAGMTWWNFYFQIFEKAIGAVETVEFLLHLLRHLPGPLLIVWDRLPAHRSRFVWDFVRDLKGLIAIEYLPPYAPELNPVEGPWGYLKFNPMANLPLTRLTHLTSTTRRHARSVQRKEFLLRAFIKHSHLPLRLK